MRVSLAIALEDFSILFELSSTSFNETCFGHLRDTPTGCRPACTLLGGDVTRHLLQLVCVGFAVVVVVYVCVQLFSHLECYDVSMLRGTASLLLLPRCFKSTKFGFNVFTFLRIILSLLFMTKQSFLAIIVNQFFEKQLAYFFSLFYLQTLSIHAKHSSENLEV